MFDTTYLFLFSAIAGLFSFNVFLAKKKSNLEDSIHEKETKICRLQEELKMKKFEQDLILTEVREFSRQAAEFRKSIEVLGFSKYGPQNDPAKEILNDFSNGIIKPN